MDKFEAGVIGAGHAGCEAALALARMGIKTILFAVNLDSIAMMPCNPNIGGSSKGHLAKEVDALGGEMGKNIDKTFIQSRMLNLAKGPAVHSLRAQADKDRYSKEMKKVLENQENLNILQNEIIEIIVEDDKVLGVRLESGNIINLKAVVLCMGTYLKARCLYGEVINDCGPNGFKNSVKLSDNLENLGIKMFRFKTGTPARIDARSLDFSKMEKQNGDEKIIPFSFENTEIDIKRKQLPCYLTYTNEKTHEVIRKNIHRSPMYSGIIEGTGTRYCPSIEDKIVRFADKKRHQVFIEPEGEYTNEMYVSGMSTSLPEDVQNEMYRTVVGLENCQITRYGYAIEYDCIDATQLKLTLEFKNIKGLFSAGQFNGSSGYEEAAAQGIVAGINAGLAIQNKEGMIIDRSEGYIGVLIDDLVTKGSKEPYRMMTSRAEYRLLLRQDNADLRLSPKGHEVGIISEKRYKKLLKKIDEIEKEIKRVNKMVVPPKEEVNKLLEQRNSSILKTGAKLAELIKRPELDYNFLAEIDRDRPLFSDEVAEQINIQIKYQGYISMQLQQVANFKKFEKKKLSLNFDYSKVYGLRVEAVQKLNALKPENIGQASRITGVSPADISVLLIYLEQKKNNN